jgi:REP element-mobilizing transposase RayT
VDTSLRPAFLPFDEHNAVRIYRRNLPHWRQDGATYFVTFRLGDSIPQSVLDQWEYEKQAWLTARGIRCGGDGREWPRQLARLSESEQYQFHKHFNRLFHAALDEGRGACYLKVPGCLATLWEKLLENDGDSYHLGDFVAMPNHVHLLLLPCPGSELEWLLKAIKGSAARGCNQLLGRSGRFWQPDSYDHIVRTLDQLVHFRQYIADNPKKAEIALAADALYHADWMDASFS